MNHPHRPTFFNTFIPQSWFRLQTLISTLFYDTHGTVIVMISNKVVANDDNEQYEQSMSSEMHADKCLQTLSQEPFAYRKHW